MSNRILQHRHSILLAVSWSLFSAVSCSRFRPSEASFLENGKRKLAARDYVRASLEFRNAVKIAPKDAEPLYQLALVHESKREFASEAGALIEATKLNPRHVAAQLKLAELMTTSKDASILDEAEQRVITVLRDEPGRPDARRVLALIEWRRGKQSQAERELRELGAKFPADPSPSLTLARLKLEQKDTAAVEELLKNAQALAPANGDVALALAQLYILTEQPSQAEPQFAQLLKEDPRNPDALLGLAVIQLKSGQLREADRSYQLLAQLPGGRYRILHALFLLNSGQEEAGILELKKLLSRDPNNREMASLLISNCLEAGRTEEAGQVIREQLKRNPGNTAVLLEHAKLMLKLGRASEAQKDLQQVLHSEPISADAHYYLAEIHRLRGEVLSERQELSQVIEYSPRHLQARLALAKLLTGQSPKAAVELLDAAPESQRKLVAVVAQRNRALFALGDLPNLRRGIDSGLKTSRTPEFVLQDGGFKFQARDFSGARAAALEVLSKEPSAEALDLLARTYISQRQIPLAIEKLRAYAERWPDSIPMAELLGQALAAHGDIEAAREVFSKVRNRPGAQAAADLALAQLDLAGGRLDGARARLSPLATDRNVTATLLLGHVELQARHYSTAIDLYRRVLTVDPRNSVALNNTALLLVEHEGSPTEALRFAEQAVEQDSENPDFEGTLGMAMYRNGAYQQARRYLEQALRHRENALCRYYLSLTYKNLGDLNRSNANLLTATRLDSKLISEKQTP